MIAEHTKGPWAGAQFSRAIWATVDGEPVMIVGRVMDAAGRDDTPEAKANQRVVAAAPRLLDALKLAVRWHDQLRPHDIDLLQAAIAQAEVAS